MFQILLLLTTTAGAQDLGHKLPGLLGLDAARIPEPGLYLVYRLASYEAEELWDRDGHLIPTAPFNLLAVANAFGASSTTRVSQSRVFLTTTVGWPIIKRDVEDRPEARVDRFGLGDPYVQPVRLGWRNGRASGDVLQHLPARLGRSALRQGPGGSAPGQITHELSSGGSLFYFKDRTSFLTALASCFIS